MPVNLYIAVNPNHNFRVKNRDLHHGNESPWANVKHPIVATAQEGRTPKERTQDLGHIYSRVGGHIRFGGASQVHGELVAGDRQANSSRYRWLRLKKCQRWAGEVRKKFPPEILGTLTLISKTTRDHVRRPHTIRCRPGPELCRKFLPFYDRIAGEPTDRSRGAQARRQLTQDHGISKDCETRSTTETPGGRGEEQKRDPMSGGIGSGGKRLEI